MRDGFRAARTLPCAGLSRLSDRASTKPDRLKACPTEQKKWLAAPPLPANHAFHSPLNRENGKEKNAVKTPEREPFLNSKSPSHGKRATAPATARSLRILKYEAAAHQVFLIIERGLVQVQEALRVDENARAVFLDDLVAVARLRLELHRVGQPRAAAALHTDAQAARFGSYTFLGEQLLNLCCRFFGYVNHVPSAQHGTQMPTGLLD